MYDSLTSGWADRIEQEVQFWESDRSMGRACRYANAELAQVLSKLRSEIESVLKKELCDSEQADKEISEKLEEDYTQFLRETEKGFKENYDKAVDQCAKDELQRQNEQEKRNESKYANALKLLAKASSLRDYEIVKDAFASIPNYKDSSNLAEILAKPANLTFALLDTFNPLAPANGSHFRITLKSKLIERSLDIVAKTGKCSNSIIIPPGEYNCSVFVVKFENNKTSFGIRVHGDATIEITRKFKPTVSICK